MTESALPAWQFSLRTAWDRSRQTPLRQFLRTETGSAAVLLAATIAALIWANVDQASYEACWGTHAVDAAWRAPGCPTTCTAGSTPA